ncbi:hypothetical protein C0Q70_07178 [Pomacea canaliculata]|uniref:Major facilitator superfamily (MFS) profile domain-containing protein n=2 Tax=Pomacea canaliculata TaxID=400727 RepID=A0A2T7PEB6_POMCA|nr:hypothetical protein C0Q70_07178 [Pomacea canaliculata]
MGQGVSMFAGGIIEHRLGPRIASLVGCWCLSAGVLLTYLTIKISFAMSVLTYGMMFGLGCGLAYPIPVTCAMKWFPEHRGLVGGIVFSGFGCGPIVFNQVITLYLNPSNLPPTQKGQDDVYFTQEEILQRVPNLFLVLGGTYAVMQLIGALLTIYPVTPQSSHEAVSSEGSPEMRGFVNSSESPENVLCNETGSNLDIPPLQMLKTKNFYLLWFLFLLGGMGGVFVVALYKSYGQSFIADDEFLAIVGSCSAVLNAVGGIFWGHVADRFTFNVAAKILYVMFASAVFTFSGAEHGGKPYFMIWVCVIFFAISGKYAIMPPAVARMYGNTYMSTNYGLLYTSQVLTSAASAFMGVTLQQMLHYTGQFFFIGGFACVGFIVTFFLDARTPDGKEV